MLCDSYSTASSFDPPMQDCYYRLFISRKYAGGGGYMCLSSTLVIFVVCSCVVLL